MSGPLVVILHPALKLEGAGRRHVVVHRHEHDRRLITTRCGVRAALMEFAKPGLWYANCRHGCAG